MSRTHSAGFVSDDRSQLELRDRAVAVLETVIDSEVALAQIFSPRDRDLAASTGSAWPEDLEAATLRHVRDGLASRFPIPDQVSKC